MAKKTAAKRQRDPNAVNEPKPKRARHKKTFSGCYTCRRRKIACDMAKPTCERCRRSGYVCEGYDIKLRWSQPLQFNKYGEQLPSLPNQQTEYCQRRSVEFVKYPPESAYQMYDEMDRDLAFLHNHSMPSRDTPTLIKGHFGVLRGTAAPPAPHGKKKLESPSTPGSVASMSSRSTQIQPQGSPSLSYSPAIAMGGSRRTSATKAPATLGNEWLSSELLDAALLTASAINGDTHFLDMFKPEDIENMDLGNADTAFVPAATTTAATTATPATTTEPEPAAYPDYINDSTADSMLHLLFQGRNSKEEAETDSTRSMSQTETPATSNRFSRSDKPITSNVIGIHAGGGASMPKTIMEILNSTPLPKSLAIDRLGIPTTALEVHPMTRYLLNYYIEDVADMMTVIPLSKNPWKFIYFPRALMAVGELAAVGHTSNARNGLLNALLAVSAFNLQSKFVRGSDEMKYYVNLGVQLRKQATNFLNKCLQEDILKQKYKDVLVAVLSMVTIDVVWGTMSACKIHLDHCEKIIEKKMKVKKKLSSKAVILHRIFSSLKLIQDSSCIDNISKDEIFLNEKNYSRFIMGAKPTADQLDRFFNSHFREMFRGSRLRKLCSKSSEGQGVKAFTEESFRSRSGGAGRGTYNERIGDNGKVKIEFIMNEEDDVDETRSSTSHMSSGMSDKGIPAFIGITRSSFQPSKNKRDDKMVSSDAIYGLPNSLILMFSEVVHLTKFLRYHTENKIPLPSFFDELVIQLEFKLLTWKLEWKLTEDDQTGNNESEPSSESDSESSTPQKPRKFLSPRHEGIYHHVMSFYYGLIIYFYRFVEGVNPMYLQDRISKVLHHLNAIQNILEKHPETSYIIPLFWQGFVAGSEAMTLYLQNGFNQWGQHIAQTGIGTYWNARQIMLETWRRKNQNVKNNSWVDVLRDWKTNVMLT